MASCHITLQRGGPPHNLVSLWPSSPYASLNSHRMLKPQHGCLHREARSRISVDVVESKRPCAYRLCMYSIGTRSIPAKSHAFRQFWQYLLCHHHLCCLELCIICARMICTVAVLSFNSTGCLLFHCDLLKCSHQLVMVMQLCPCQLVTSGDLLGYCNSKKVVL